MSFLGDIVSSIGGDRAPAPPRPPPPSSKAVASTPTNKTVQPGASSIPRNDAPVKAVYKGTIGKPTSSQVSLKRKADEALSEQARSLKLNSVDSKPPSLKSATVSPVSQDGSSLQKAPAKVPVKGSYAEIMARAKEAQQTRAPSQVGVIKHQSTEKVKTSKLAERRKEEQDKIKNSKTGNVPRPIVGNSKADVRRRSVSPVKKSGQSTSLKAPKPPLHGPQLPPKPAYKGTMGLHSTKSRGERRPKSGRSEEYLGTDEEDEGDGDDGYGGGSDDYSDASSDMEARLDDVEAEERAALRAAKEDDLKELELENRLKREKQQRIAALAAKHRRR